MEKIPTAFLTIHKVYSIDGKIFEMSKEDRIKMYKTEAKRLTQNRQVYQQSYLIALLNSHGYEFIINPLYKKGKILSQMFTFQRISKDGCVYYNENYFQTICNNLKERRRNLDATVNNILITLLKREGYFVEEKNTRKLLIEHNIKMVRIKSISYNRKRNNTVQIYDKGKKCYEYLRSHLTTKNCFILPPYEYSLNSPL